MVKNRVLVFDSYHYFSRFLKYEFKDIKFITGEKEAILYKNEVYSDFSLIVFVFYSEENLLDLLRLYAYGVNILVCNHSPKFENKFRNIENIGVLDCFEPKKAYRSNLHLYFDKLFYTEKEDRFRE
ncbi:hypothetical protein AB9T89_13015 [Flavobacterium oncorhynchi]|uniref:hypothetical protein n=1 Tax=Flavobacterium oncorhynchi TaxID=728056 RepID=UPI003519E78E